MKKVTTVSLFGIGIDETGSGCNKRIATLLWKDENIDFNMIRYYMKDNHKNFLDAGIKLTKKFKYKMSICIVTDKNTIFKNFEINPNNIKHKEII